MNDHTRPNAVTIESRYYEHEIKQESQPSMNAALDEASNVYV